MKKSTTLQLLSLWLLCFACSPSPVSEESNTPQKPNYVIILTDDQGWGDLSRNGNPLISTPNIDQLGKDGVSFDRFYVSAVCSPTRAELLTGRYAVRSGIYSTSAGGERMDLDETTFADLLQDAGYATGAFGKWHSGMQPPYHPNARGFSEYYGFCSGHWGSYFDAMIEHNGDLIQSEGYLTDYFTTKAMEFMESHKEEPFLVYLPLNTPHSPMQVPEKWYEKYKEVELPEHRYSNKEQKNHTRAAYAMVENIDWNVGRINQKLTDLGIEENTVVIYLSDNGPNGWRWNGGMEGIKGSTNEGGLRTPFFIQWKGTLPAGKEVATIASARDVLPTLLDLANIQPKLPKPLDGKSLKPLLEEENPEWPERTLISHWRGKTSLRNQTFRLDHENKLFHMLNDPGQTKDVSTVYPDAAQQLLAQKEAWERDILPELPEVDERTFPFGHPDFTFTQIPARDAQFTGNIKRSNRYPNCSFLTNWTSTTDTIRWPVEILSDGKYKIQLYYTCKESDLAPTLSLQIGDQQVQQVIEEAFDPPLRGAEYDKFERIESYVKDFKEISMGTMDLKAGETTLVLTAPQIPGEQAIDFRLLLVEKI